ESFCLPACQTDTDCPDNYQCMQSIESVDGSKANVCVPSSFDCRNVGGSGCPDDKYEQNDTMETAKQLPPFDLTGQTEPEVFICCPLDENITDEDWYFIDVTETQRVSISMGGDTVSDLDLTLYKDGTPIAISHGGESYETI